MRLVLIYRPPPSKKNKLTIPMFFEEFSQLAEILAELPVARRAAQRSPIGIMGKKRKPMS